MTTFHDPPPQSRRAARQSERERASREQPTVEGFTTFPSQSEDGQPSEPAQPSPSVPANDTEHAANSAAAPPASAQPAAADAYRFAPPPTPQQVNTSSFAPRTTSPQETAEPTATVAPVAAPARETENVASSEASAVERTLTRRELRELRARMAAQSADGSAAAEEPAARTAPSEPAPASRAPSNEQSSFEPPMPAYIEPPALIDPLAVAPETVSPQAAPDDALSVFESLLANADGSEKAAAETVAPRSPLIDSPAVASPSTATPADLGAEPDATSTSEPAEPQQQSRRERGAFPGRTPETAESVAAARTRAEADAEAFEVASASQTSLSEARAEFDEMARKRLEGELPSAGPILVQSDLAVPADRAVQPPVPAPVDVEAQATAAPQVDSQTVQTSGEPTVSDGHWTRQAAIEDDTTDAVIARQVGSGTSATSALVLPAIPFANDIRGPLSSNGEIILTGSIDLPSTLSASGVSDRFDRGDIDSLLDLNDSDMVSTDSAPVRAVKAVSTFSNQAVTQTQKPKGTRALTVLLISASSMAVVVAGLLVAAFAFNML